MSMDVLTVVSSTVAALASNGVLLALVKRSEKRDTNEAKTAMVNEREATARHRIDADERTREATVLERQLDAKGVEHSKCEEALAASNKAITAVSVELAECRTERKAQHRFNKYLLQRIDKLDGGSIPPPPVPEENEEES